MTHRLQETARRTGLPDADALALQALRALPGNVTYRYGHRCGICPDRPFRSAPGASSPTPTPRWPAACGTGHLPPVAQTAIEEFLAAYGMRGIAEIDLEHPALARRSDAAARHAAGLRGHRLRRRLSPGRARRGPAGRRGRDRPPGDVRDVRRLSIRADAAHIRATMGARETPKFGIIRGFGMIRERLADEETALADAHVLPDPTTSTSSPWTSCGTPTTPRGSRRGSRSDAPSGRARSAGPRSPA